MNNACTQFQYDLLLLGDCDCDPACSQRIEEHISVCGSCREEFIAHQKLCRRLRKRCADTASEDLKKRLIVRMQQVTITSTTYIHYKSQ